MSAIKCPLVGATALFFTEITKNATVHYCNAPLCTCDRSQATSARNLSMSISDDFFRNLTLTAVSAIRGEWMPYAPGQCSTGIEPFGHFLSVLVPWAMPNRVSSLAVCSSNDFGSDQCERGLINCGSFSQLADPRQIRWGQTKALAELYLLQ